ncbi:MAG TPA: hypothetical protein VKB40_12290 [Candidatus Acidoferrales bacterium]|nr:hypothetical protein [Candidatus Acidoferrales bacterium]
MDPVRRIFFASIEPLALLMHPRRYRKATSLSPENSYTKAGQNSDLNSVRHSSSSFEMLTGFSSRASLGLCILFIASPGLVAQHSLHSSDQSSSAISTEPPSVPVGQIVQHFAEREAEFKRERDNYTYTQTFVVQTIDSSGQPDGEYRMTSDIVFSTTGKRYDKVTYAPPSTLQRVSLSEQDFADLQNVQPFVLTTNELPKYDINYVGRQRVDELSTYVFEVKPKKIEKNQRYFQGRIWVDEKDLEIVKTYGKAVPDILKRNEENFFPRFETYRENIEGHYWFPTYTHADDILHFSSGDIRIRMTVRYKDYKRFRVTSRILLPGEAEEVKP